MGRPIVLLDLDETLVLTHEIAPLRLHARRKEAPWDAVYAAFDRTTLPPGTHEFVRWLEQEATVGVVTSAHRVYAERLLRAHGLPLPVVVAYHDTERHKPDPQPLERALELLHREARDAVYIGDDDDDATATLNAGVIPLQMGWDADVECKPTPGIYRSWATMRQALQRLWDAGRRPTPDTNLIRVRPDDYDEENLSVDWHDRWYTPNAHATLTYRPLARSDGEASEATRIVLDFKGGHRRAVEYAAAFLAFAVERHEAYLRDIRQVRYVAPIPGHAVASGYSPVADVARLLADRFPWLSLEGHIERVHEVPKSSTASVRPTAAMHASSMRWQGPRLTSDDGVLLVDDVLTRGATFAGAQATVIAATACRSIVGMFLARTYSSSPSLEPIPWAGNIAGPERDADVEDIVALAVPRLGYSESAVRHAVGAVEGGASVGDFSAVRDHEESATDLHLAVGAIVAAIGRPVPPFIVTHILRGSTGPTIQAIIAACDPPHVGLLAGSAYADVHRQVLPVWGRATAALRLLKPGDVPNGRAALGGMPSNHGRRWDAAAEDDGRTSWEAGETVASIAARLGRTPESVAWRLTKFGIVASRDVPPASRSDRTDQSHRGRASAAAPAAVAPVTVAATRADGPRVSYGSWRVMAQGVGLPLGATVHLLGETNSLVVVASSWSFRFEADYVADASQGEIILRSKQGSLSLRPLDGQNPADVVCKLNGGLLSRISAGASPDRPG
jgi:HAD superfamily hydrolase (TIGR01549 family)